MSPTAVELGLDTSEELGEIDSQTSRAFARSEGFISLTAINQYTAADNASVDTASYLT